MEDLYNQLGKITKRAVSKTLLSEFGWGQKQSSTFQAFKSDLSHQVTIYRRDEPKHLCVYTDVSDTS